MDIPFKLPTRIRVNGRTTSISNAFVSHITPQVRPTQAELEWALGLLDQSPSTIRCSYCAGPYRYWDHFRPLVQNKRPTGYITEIHNLVPCCSTCNESKGNANWRDWIQGNAKGSPKLRAPEGLQQRIVLLEKFERTTNPGVIRIDFAALIPGALWNEHWNNHATVISATEKCLPVADQILALVKVFMKDALTKRAGTNQALQPPPAGKRKGR